MIHPLLKRMAREFVDILSKTTALQETITVIYPEAPFHYLTSSTSP